MEVYRRPMALALLLGAMALTTSAFPGPPDADYLEMINNLMYHMAPESRYSAAQALERQMYEDEQEEEQREEQLREQQWLEDEETHDDPTGSLTVVEQWPVQDLKLGQVGGVAVSQDGYPHVFHRADRTWEQDSFDPNTNKYLKQAEGPIMAATVVKLNGSNGVPLDSWGAGQFYMPHGFTLDRHGNAWLTDVAMHQVFKFPAGEKKPSLVLGEAFEPATSDTDLHRFCKPTDVAVAADGSFFVADGYCNSRVIKYSPEGRVLGQLGVGELLIPHSLALLEDEDRICVADREHMRVLCFNAGVAEPSLLGRPEAEYNDRMMGRVFAIDYSPRDRLLYVVGTGDETEEESRPQGFTIDVSEEQMYYIDIVSTWSPRGQGFDSPHDLAVAPGGEAVYVGELTNRRKLWKFVKDTPEEELNQLKEDDDEPEEDEEEQEDDEDDEEREKKDEESDEEENSEKENVEEKEDSEVKEVDESKEVETNEEEEKDAKNIPLRELVHKYIKSGENTKNVNQGEDD